MRFCEYGRYFVTLLATLFAAFGFVCEPVGVIVPVIANGP